MILWPIVLGPVIFLVARRAWHRGYRILGVGRAGFSWLAARIGVAADVELTSVLAEGSTVLIGFRPAATSPRSRCDLPELDQLLLVPDANPDADADADPDATIAQLRRWVASGTTIVMWRDRIVGHVEPSHVGSGQLVTLSVVPSRVVTIAA